MNPINSFKQCWNSLNKFEKKEFIADTLLLAATILFSWNTLKQGITLVSMAYIMIYWVSYASIYYAYRTVTQKRTLELELLNLNKVQE